jgi:hypothetical protein
MLAPEYVTGLVDASGSFTFSRSAGNISVYFLLRLPERDRVILEELQSYWGGGRIYPANPGSLYYRVSRHDELLPVVDHFDRYPLQGHKREAFGVWRELVEIKSRFRQPNRERLDELARRLSSLSSLTKSRASRTRPAKP